MTKSVFNCFVHAHERIISGLQEDYKADDLILIFSAMTTYKLQNNYRITSDPFSEPFVHPTLTGFTGTDALRFLDEQQKTALNMAKFIQNQSLLLLEATSLISMLRPTFVRNSTMMRSIFSIHCPRDWMHYRMVTDGQVSISETARLVGLVAYYLQDD